MPYCIQYLIFPIFKYEGTVLMLLCYFNLKSCLFFFSLDFYGTAVVSERTHKPTHSHPTLTQRTPMCAR
uniref:Uncharacterized protein n=1 Tax=Arundo donax TaxID=35708 RepID=A0A0A9A0W1_ARUDO